jgi:flavorubredoxin
LFEETTKTLFCGDLFTQVGAPPPVLTDDLVPAAMAAEEMFHSSSLAPQTGATIRQLAALEPETLAVMHGASFRGDGRAALHSLADAYDELAASST